jgi:hypothetical protein
MKQYLTLRPNDRNAMGVLEKLRIVLEGDTLQTAPK